MDISLRVLVDLDKTTEQFKKLVDSGEMTKDEFNKLSDAMDKNINKSLEDFNKKQGTLQENLKFSRNETEALKTSSNNYQKQIEDLLKAGLTPQSEAVKKLKEEQQKLKDKIQNTTDAQKAQVESMKNQEQVIKNVEKAAKACFAAIGAGVAALAAITQSTAKAGDELSKTSRYLNMTVEGLQEFEYVAKQNNINNLTGHLEKLNKSVLDVKSGTGNLTKYLQENNTELLNNLKNVKNNDEAFSLIMQTLNDTTDEFEKSKLALEVFGKSGAEITNMASSFSQLREESRKYGIISNETARASEEFMSAQTRLKQAFSGIGTEISSGIIPNITKVINSIADFIAKIDDWEKVINIAIYALSGLTAGLVTFLAVTKGGAAINAITTAFKGLNAVIAKNPIGAIATLIVAVIIPAFIALYKNWDTVQTYINQGIARLEYAFKWFGSQIQEKFIIAVNGIKIAFLSLADILVTNVLGAVAKILEVLGKLPFVGDMFKSASASVLDFARGFSDAADEAKESSRQAIQDAKDYQDAIGEELRAKLENADETARLRREELEAEKNAINEEIELKQNSINTQYEMDVEHYENQISLLSENEKDKIEIIQNSENEITDIKLKSLNERLNEIMLTESQIQNDQISNIENFLLQRANLESADYEERLAFLISQKEYLLNEENGFSDERIAIEQATNNAIKKIQDEQANHERELLENRIGAFTQFVNGYAQLLGTIGEKNKGAAVLAKGLAMAEAGINSGLAFTKALASGVPPFNFIAAAGVLAAGLAQQIQIANTPIPSKETGGRFIVPQSSRVDDKLYRFNGGEEIQVTPRSMTGSGNESFNFNLLVDGQVFANLMNVKARAGELYSLKLA